MAKRLTKEQVEREGEAIMERMRLARLARNRRRNQQARARRAYHRHMKQGFFSRADLE
jgi:hypothetical protein